MAPQKGINRATQNVSKYKAANRSELTAVEKLSVLTWYYKNGKNQKKTALHFKQIPGFEKLNQGTISRWLSTGC